MNEVETSVADIVIEDIEYLHQHGLSLMATVYRPSGPGPFPMVLEVHGGAWCRGSRQDEHSLNLALAGQGVAVAALDFRMPPDATYPASLQDINFALRCFKADAQRWRTAPEMVGIMGVSSGGHQAVLTALRAHDTRYAAVPLAADSGTDACAAFVIACWPVIDPLGRYRYARTMQASGTAYPEALDRVIPDHEKYWLSEDAMLEGSPTVALESGENLEMPPILCIQGEADIVHPRAHLDRFVAAYGAAGGEVTLRTYPGHAEGFILKQPAAAASLQAIRDIVAFVKLFGAA